MNAVIDTLNTVMDAVIGALAMGLSAITKTMLANIHATEWTTGLLLILSVWLLASRRGRPAWGLALFLLAVGAGVWLSWKTGHTGVTAQQAALAAVVLHGQLRARGWALVRGYSKR